MRKDLTEMDKRLQDMKFLFNLSSVAVVGTAQNAGKLGFHVIKSLTKGGFGGKIFPINPGARKIMGMSCYPFQGGKLQPSVSMAPDKLHGPVAATSTLRY